jgi:putative transposase
MLGCVERRFNAPRATFPVQWLADNGSVYTLAKTTDFAAALNLVPYLTPVNSPQSTGVYEAFVKAPKRDLACENPRAHTISVLRQLPACFEDYYNIDPH